MTDERTKTWDRLRLYNMPAHKKIEHFFGTSRATYYEEYENNFRNNVIQYVNLEGAPETENSDLIQVVHEFIDSKNLNGLFKEGKAIIAGSSANSLLSNKKFDEEAQDIDIFVNKDVFLDIFGSKGGYVLGENFKGYDFQIIGLHDDAEPVHLFCKFANTNQCYSWNPITKEKYSTNLSMFHEQHKIFLPFLRSNMPKSYLKSFYKYARKGYGLLGHAQDIILYEWIKRIDLNLTVEEAKAQSDRY